MGLGFSATVLREKYLRLFKIRGNLIFPPEINRNSQSDHDWAAVTDLHSAVR